MRTTARSRGSQAYTGRVVWRGVPIATDDPQVAVDTIVERLDDVTFDRLGRATTRLKVRALHANGGCEHCVQVCSCGDFPISPLGGPCDG